MDSRSRAWGLITCEKIDRMASWMGANMASAFFSSLERCSCITLGVDDDFDSSKDRSLLLPDSPVSSSSSSAAAAAAAADSGSVTSPPV